jgi:hypothetical protein
MEGLTEFLLVLQAIARVDIGTSYYPLPLTRTIAWQISIDPQNPDVAPANNQGATATVTINVDQDGLLTPGANQPAIPPKGRFDNVGQNADLKAIINATAKSSM